MIIFFWIILFMLLYTYLGFPLTLWIALLFKNKPALQAEGFLPSISLIIPVFNEEKSISAKLENSFELEYPKDRLKIIVVSDGSTDRTNQIVQECKNKAIKFICYKERKGKLTAMAESLKYVEGEIIVFTDADTIIEKNALINIVSPFRDASVGGVCASIRYIQMGEPAKFRQLYWRLEESIRLSEAKLDALCFATGPFWAVRKFLFPKDAPAHFPDDVFLPMYIVKKGYRMTMEEAAVARTLPQPTAVADFISLNRTVITGLCAIVHHKELLNPFKYPTMSFCLFWHKIMRWSSGLFLAGLFLVNCLLLDVIFFRYLFFAQAIFYGLAATGFIMPRLRKNLVIRLPFYLCLNLISILIAFVQGVTCSKKINLWQPAR